MKIGIVTFHWSRNYGAALQTFALNEFFRKEKFDSYIINYNPIYKKKKKSFSNIIKDNVLLLLLLFDKKNNNKQLESFQNFRNEYFNLTNNTNKKKRFDMIFCGSDQIWNPNLTGGCLDRHYFGLFEDIDSQSISSYAASIGENRVPLNAVKDFSQYISALDNISVREKQIVDEVKKYTSKDVQCVVDPTLLLTKEDYLKITDNHDKIENQYVLIYQNSKNADVYKIARKIAKEKNIKIIEVAYRKQYPPTGIKTITSAGPKEFLSLYNNASYIVTNTFHGTVFAIQFEKEFVSIPLKGRESRVENLANITGLNDHLLNCAEDVKLDNIIKSKIDYSLVKEKLEVERNKSKQYIYNCITNLEEGD